MKITVQNYEAFLLDWMEGNLSSEESCALDAFFVEHPELDERELLSTELPSLEVAEVPAYDKVSLFKGVASIGKWNAANYEEGLIAAIEGELNSSEKEELYSFLEQDTSFQKEFELYKQVLLKPDYTITAHKKPLLKTAPIILISRAVVGLSVAASLAFLLSIGINFNQKSESFYAQRTSSVEFPSLVKEDAVFTVNSAGSEIPSRVRESMSSNKATDQVYDNRFEEKKLFLDPLKVKMLKSEVNALNLPLAINRVNTQFESNASSKADELFAVTLLNKAKNFLFNKSHQGIEKVEKAITNTTEPIIGNMDDVVAYEQTINQSRKTWRFALGPIEINRITYQ